MTPEENTEKIHEKFHEDIQILLIRSKRQQKQLAEALGMTKGNFATFLHKRTSPVLLKMCRIADLFGYELKLTLVKKEGKA